MTTKVSYKINKKKRNNQDDWVIIPQTQPEIIDENTFYRVQQLRKNRHRCTKTGETSLFSNIIFFQPNLKPSTATTLSLFSLIRIFLFAISVSNTGAEIMDFVFGNSIENPLLIIFPVNSFALIKNSPPKFSSL